MPKTIIYEEPVKLIREKEYEKAQEALQAILDENPDDGWAHMYMGITYARMNKRMYAIAELEEAARLKESAISLYNLGEMYRMVFRIDEAVRQYKTAVELNDKYEPALKALEKMSEKRSADDAAEAAEEESREHETLERVAAENAAREAEMAAAAAAREAGELPEVNPADFEGKPRDMFGHIIEGDSLINKEDDFITDAFGNVVGTAADLETQAEQAEADLDAAGDAAADEFADILGSADDFLGSQAEEKDEDPGDLPEINTDNNIFG